MWNRVNQYLFNFIDSSILQKFITILFERGNLKAFIENINFRDELTKEDIQRNFERNKDLMVYEMWSEKLLIAKFNQRMQDQYGVREKKPLTTYVQKSNRESEVPKPMRKS